MGLDVYLYQFKDVDTDVVLELSRLSEEPYNNEEFRKWKAMPPSERRNSFPTKERKSSGYQKLVARAQELGFPKSRFAQPGFGGTEISFPSRIYPELPVGNWYSFNGVRELMEFFTGSNIYSVFPEAENVYGLFRPDWAKSRKKLADILDDLRRLKPGHFQDYYAQFEKPELPWHLLNKVKPEQIASVPQILSGRLAQIEVMIETLDFVLNSSNREEFLLYWSP